jgi:hypothetical protein
MCLRFFYRVNHSFLSLSLSLSLALTHMRKSCNERQRAAKFLFMSTKKAILCSSHDLQLAMLLMLLLLLVFSFWVLLYLFVLIFFPYTFWLFRWGGSHVWKDIYALL